ncbi:MAG TPA: hypothetical protein VFK87_00420, partial [Steroidobacteraceae bacterium]|nr:hypothetical protein [Steroidobacteraceae bacterium]
IDPDSQLLTVSVYRRPLPAANLSFLSAVMFDGRETLAPLASPQTFAANLRADLARQASDATTGHAQARSPPADAVVQSIVDFELGLFTAQYADRTAGPLDARGADGGPIDLAAQRYYPGINDPLGADPAGAPFAPDAMSLFRAWESSAGEPGDGDDGERARADIAAGERLFNSEVLRIRDVRGLNDNASLGRPALILGHCSTCHDAPNVGNHSLPLPLDIGTAHSADPSLEPDPRIRAAVAQLDPPQLPVFLISGCPDAFGSGRSASFYTTDPGRALITGRCSDLNLIKGPVLRGLAARAPYFHNGAASTLMQVVNFYDQRFEIGLTLQQKRQLAAFLDSL